MTDIASLAERIGERFSALSTEIGFCATHLQRGETAAVNADALFPTASVFKVPVMVEVFRQADEGRFALSDRMTLAHADRSVGSGVLKELADGLAPTVRDLLMLMIIISDNTATQMMLDLVGPESVTATMRRLGLADIHVVLRMPELFAHAYGLPPDPAPDFDKLKALGGTMKLDYGGLTFAASPRNTTSTARDMARLMALIFEKRAGSAAACEDMLAILQAQQLRARVPRFLPTKAVGNKTGTFGGVRNDAGLIMRGEGDTIAFALFTFDRTELPPGNSRLLGERDAPVTEAMAEVGWLLWTEFAA